MAHTVKKQVTAVVKRLETVFGAPQWQGATNPLDSLVKTILSQNTSDHNRDIAYERLVLKFPSWEKILDADVKEIAAAIRPAGLANQKSARIREILRWIQKNYGTLNLDFLCKMEPSEAMEIFMQLKGIGIKTISVVLMVACGVDIFPVDTHVHRICRRLGWVPDHASAQKTHELMQPLVPRNKSYSLHMNLLRLGRTICKSRIPQCRICPLNDTCPSAMPSP